MSSLKAKSSARSGSAGPALPAAAEIVIGTIAMMNEAGEVFVDHDFNPAGSPVRAELTVAIDAAAIGRRAALTFLGGDPMRPVVIGLLREAPATEASPAVVVQRDEERLVLSARQEIVLQCGKASITLTRAGKVLVRGAYVSLRSSGMQRITGASVHIN